MTNLKDVVQRTLSVTQRLDFTDNTVAERLKQSATTVYGAFGYGAEEGIDHFLKQLSLEGYSISELVHAKQPIAGLEGSEHLSPATADQLISAIERTSVDSVRAAIAAYAEKHAVTLEAALYTLLHDPEWLDGLAPVTKTLELHAGRAIDIDINKYVLTPAQLHIGDHRVTTELMMELIPTKIADPDIYVVSTEKELLGYLYIGRNPSLVVFTTSASSEYDKHGSNLVITINLS